jgi:hypothetical protein
MTGSATAMIASGWIFTPDARTAIRLSRACDRGFAVAEYVKHADSAQLDGLLHLKRDVNILRRQSLPQRELLNQIFRGDAQYDHMFRISETIDVERDMMARTVKVLTIFSTIMLTLIAGIYGMNFANEPELHGRCGY